MDPRRLFLLDVNRVALDTTTDMQEYPVGLLYVATALREAFGERLQLKVGSYHDRPGNWPQLERDLLEWRPDVLGLRSLTMGRPALHRIATFAREGCGIRIIVVGGPHATTCPEDVLANPAVDCAVIGEGERTAVELLGRILAGRPFGDVPGIAVRNGDGIRRTPPRPPVEPLDELPIPDHSLVDLPRAHEGFVDFSFRHGVPHANLFTSRGCPYGCLYCHSIFGKRFRAHSPERTFEELRRIHDEYGIRHFQILDDIFNIDRDRALRFLELVISSRLSVVLSFPNGVRGDLVDEEMVEAMWAAGVRYVAYAVESGSPRIQKLIRKNLDLDRIREAIALTTRRGILTRGFFMLGFPTETEEEARSTVRFAVDSDLALAIFFTVVYFPGTPLARLAAELCDLDELDLGLEDDYVHTREGPYAFSRAVLDQIKRDAVRTFTFSDRRLELFFRILPSFYGQRDIDASLLAAIISAELEEKELAGSRYERVLRRHLLVARRFSERSGFFV